MGKKRANGEGSIRKRKDGRWEGFYTASYDPATGKQKIKNVLGKTQAEVKEKLKKAIADSQRLDMNRSGTHTVKSWVKMWYEVYAEPRLRENTKDYYLNYINNHIIPQLGDIKLDKLTTIQIQKFYNDLQKNGRVQRYQHKGLGNIPREKREKYIQILGKEKFNREGVFVLNIINRIEENDKIDFLLRLLESKLDGEIDDTTYRRLMVLVDRTLYSDLLYLKDHVTKRPIEIGEREEFGLVASGLISSDGLGWESVTAEQPTVLLFRYTPAAQQLAEILFGKQREY